MLHYRKNLINQEAKFQSQLNDLSKQLSVRDAEANKLRFQMEELQRDVFAKSAGIDRECYLLLLASKLSGWLRNFSALFWKFLHACAYCFLFAFICFRTRNWWSAHQPPQRAFYKKILLHRPCWQCWLFMYAMYVAKTHLHDCVKRNFHATEIRENLFLLTQIFGVPATLCKYAIKFYFRFGKHTTGRWH